VLLLLLPFVRSSPRLLLLLTWRGFVRPLWLLLLLTWQVLRAAWTVSSSASRIVDKHPE
jgi:cytochrome oxidase assembly protein ShyY1